MYEAVQKCKSCGAGLTLDDMRRTECPYCQVVYPHHSQAAQHAQMMGLMMNQMVAQQLQVQDQWRQPYGAPPAAAPGPPQGPPPDAAPVPPGHSSPYGNPYGNPHQVAQVHLQQAARLSGGITLLAIAVVAVVFLVVLLAIGLTVVLAFV